MKAAIKILILFLIAGTAYAQPRIHLGMTTGFNTTYVLDKGLSSNPSYVAKANYEWAPIGFSGGIDITKRIGFQFESIKAAQGQIYQLVETAQNVQKMVAERNIDLQYLQFPLLLRMMGGSNNAARFNFQIGPQLSILNSGSEVMRFVEDGTLNLQDGGDIPIDVTTVMVGSQGDIPQEYIQDLASGAVTPPSMNEMEIPLEYFENAQNPGQFDIPQDAIMTLMNSEVESEIQKFKDKEVQLAFGFGMDFDVLKHFYLSANVRANYSFTDMRNQDLIDYIGDKDITSIFNNRANLLVGVQLGLHWVIGGNRSFRAKAKKASEEEDVIR